MKKLNLAQHEDPDDLSILCPAACSERGNRGFCYFVDFERCDLYTLALFNDGKLKKYEGDKDG